MICSKIFKNINLGKIYAPTNVQNMRRKLASSSYFRFQHACFTVFPEYRRKLMHGFPRISPEMC